MQSRWSSIQGMKTALVLILPMLIFSLAPVTFEILQETKFSVLAFWPINEGAGLIIYDQSRNRNNGTIEGIESGQVAPWIDEGLKFNGKNISIEVPDSQILDFDAQESFTIECHLAPSYMNSIPEKLRHTLHKKIMAYRSLIDILIIHGFEIKEMVGAGYFPFSKSISSILSSLDPRHAHFITVLARKANL